LLVSILASGIWHQKASNPLEQSSSFMPSNIRIVSATRSERDRFSRDTLLGKSLRRLGTHSRIDLAVSYGNRTGLPVIYNRHITEENRDAILVFVHDDVWIDDYFFAQRIIQALNAFDVIGIAGNARGGVEQCGWLFLERPGYYDCKEHLSGAVAHQSKGVSWYGPTPRRVKLLDGVFLAAHTNTLLRTGVRFDPVFDFHFYDMDFCRSATQAGLRLGTWPIAITHKSGGRFGTVEWQAAAIAYFAKWRNA